MTFINWLENDKYFVKQKVAMMCIASYSLLGWYLCVCILYIPVNCFSDACIFIAGDPQHENGT
jgi:hypothetical protein